MNEQLREWSERIEAAAAAGETLELRGGGSKRFYGQPPRGTPLDTRSWSGVVAYEPTELVITARCGTPLAEIEQTLAGQGQMLPFEPPAFGADATIGGCVAAGLSGPRRQVAGPLRDFVLGVRIIDGQGELQRFGGQVMKNVAGYDVSRLITGSLGTLALLTEVSLKVMPRPAAEATVVFELEQADALARLNRWGGEPWPLSASFWHRGRLWLRLSGASTAVSAARAQLGGELLDAAAGAALWESVREQTHAFFEGPEPLWRFAVPSDAGALDLPGELAVEWGGGQRWLRGGTDSQRLRASAAGAGGHATLFRGGDKAVGAFHPLPAPIATLNRRLKQALDPHGVFGRGRMYPEL